MAISKNGANGQFSGKVGTIIGYELGGQNIIRVVGERRKPFTQLELLNQAKMRAVSEFLAPIKHAIRLGYANLAPKGSRIGAFQLAQSHTRKYAIDYDQEGNPYVDPAKVLVFRGNLEPPVNCRAEREGNTLIIRWDNPGPAVDHYHVVILLYDGDSFRSLRESGAQQRDQQDDWKLGNISYARPAIHVYVAFRDILFGGFSDSVYVGTISNS